MEIKNFSEIEDEFIERVHRMVWCNVATVDGKGRAPSHEEGQRIWRNPAEGKAMGTHE